MITKMKAHVYATHKGQLLAFSHTECPEVGYQVPGGTVDPGETPVETARRELREETGLEIASNELQAIGVYEHDMRPFRDEIQQRHVFHVELADAQPSSWYHFETHPDAKGQKQPEKFAFRWLPYNLGAMHILSVGQGKLIGRLSVSQPQDSETGLPSRLEYEAISQRIAQFQRERALSRLEALSILEVTPNNLPDFIVELPSRRALIEHLILDLRRLKKFDVIDYRAATDTWQRIRDMSESFVCVSSHSCSVVDSVFESPLYLCDGKAMIDSKLIQDAVQWIETLGMNESILGSLGLVIYLSQKGALDATNSYTLHGVPGTLFVDTVEDSFRMGEIILHEAIHNWFNDALDAFAVELPTDPIWWSPWRHVKRPACGIIHAGLVFSKLVQYYYNGLSSGRLNAYQSAYARSRLEVETAVIRRHAEMIGDAMGLISSVELRDLCYEEVNRAINLPSV